VLNELQHKQLFVADLEGPKHGVNKIRKTKYIVVFEGNNKQFIY